MTRADAARWVSARLGRRVSQEQLRAWEARGLLDRKRVGKGKRARFDACDATRALLVARLRLIENEPVQRVRAVSRVLSQQEIASDERIAVDRSGRVVLVRGNAGDLDRFTPIIPVGAWFQAAKDAVEERIEVCRKSE